MSTFETTLIAREEVADRTMAFHFARPGGFEYTAGQAIDLCLSGVPVGAAAGICHAFSLVSAPFQPELTIATRLRDSAYKRALESIPIGAGATIDEELLRRVVGDPGAPTYCVVGPPALVEAVQATLQFAGVAPQRIATEAFQGYG